MTKNGMAGCEIVLVLVNFRSLTIKKIAVCEIVVVFGELVVVHDKENGCW